MPGTVYSFRHTGRNMITIVRALSNMQHIPIIHTLPLTMASESYFWFHHHDKTIYRYFQNHKTGNRSGVKTDSLSLHALQLRHNWRDGVSNHRRLDFLLNCLSRRRSKKTLKHCVTGFCEGNSPDTGEFPAQRASNAKNVSLKWRHHGPALNIAANKTDM